jgi:hypothetical protein
VFEGESAVTAADNQQSNQLEAGQRHPLSPPQPELLAEPPELAEFECWLEGNRCACASVAEMMTDEAGNVYEMSGQQLRRLGELVSDKRGRIFEIQKTVMAHIAERR